MVFILICSYFAKVTKIKLLTNLKYQKTKFPQFYMHKISFQKHDKTTLSLTLLLRNVIKQFLYKMAKMHTFCYEIA